MSDFAKIIFDFLNNASDVDSSGVPYTFNDFEDDLTIGIDGEVDCKKFAAALVKAFDAAGFAIVPKLTEIQIGSGDLIKGRRTIGGRVTRPAAEIDFNATYAFKATDESGRVFTWVNVKPTRQADVAVFELAEQDIAATQEPKP